MEVTPRNVGSGRARVWDDVRNRRVIIHSVVTLDIFSGVLDMDVVGRTEGQ